MMLWFLITLNRQTNKAKKCNKRISLICCFLTTPCQYPAGTLSLVHPSSTIGLNLSTSSTVLSLWGPVALTITYIVNRTPLYQHTNIVMWNDCAITTATTIVSAIAVATAAFILIVSLSSVSLSLL